MDTTRQRARDLLPAVLLTLLSMIQALALELFWSDFHEREHLWQGGWPALLGWLQVAAIVLGVLEVWLFYLSLLMRFTWVPGVREMLLPFGIGLLEFTLIDLQGPERIGEWLLVIAAIFGVSIFESHMIFRAARRDPANAEFFEGVEPASLADHLPQILLVGFLAILGVVVWWSGSQSWLALMAIGFTLAALVRQLAVTHFYWVTTITGERAR